MRVRADTRVTYRQLTEWADLERAARVVGEIWEDPALASPSLLRAYTHFGNPTFGAFDRDEMCGVSIAFLAPSGGVHLHSHITGVLPGWQHLGVGFGLKSAQRDWCLANGVSTVTWTFDPMIARNAYFNLHKLGAVARALLPGFYGEMHDAFNAGELTDRLETHWPVTSERVRDALGRRLGPVADVVCTVEVPGDYHALRRDDPALAQQWRLRVRDELTVAFGQGLEIVDFAESRFCFAPRRDW